MKNQEFNDKIKELDILQLDKYGYKKYLIEGKENLRFIYVYTSRGLRLKTKLRYASQSDVIDFLTIELGF